jgi:predicted DCC family thiol-disulfide oxidoreductase YuxK
MESKKAVRDIGAQESNKTEIKYSIILFDGICNFCNSSINFIIKHDLNNQFRFAPLQSEIGKQLLLQLDEQDLNINTIILIENNRIYKQSDALLRIARHFNGVYSLLYGFIIIPSFLRNKIYNFIARNRYRLFGKTNTCVAPTPELKQKFIS